MRSASFLALVLGVALLAASVGVAERDRTQRAAAVDHALRGAVDVEKSQLAEYFSRARSIDLITARNPAFRDFYAAPGDRVAKLQSRGHALRGAEEALVYLERLYPGRIGEACFIDLGGAENARAVRGFRAGLAMLSTSERRNPFFAPTFRLHAGEVYQARPYVSPDTQEWVISNSTPLPGTGYPAKAIVHFEITVESLRREAADSTGEHVLVVEARTGRVLVDSSLVQERGAPLGRPRDQRFAALPQRAGTAGLITLGDARVAYARLPRAVHNQNDWLIVAEHPRAGTSGLRGVGWAAIATALAGLALLAVGALSLRSSRRTLHDAAYTDALTGLANRRRLLLDLDAACARASADTPVVLVLYDLDGFKAYNDAFGHLPGDGLLRRMGLRLAEALGNAGRAYRLGGDEFCVLAPIAPGASAQSIAGLGAEALSEAGEGFAITASFGVLVIPDESRVPAEVLATADSRMYASKHGGRRSAARQTTDVLLRVQHERSPELGPHVSDVGELAVRVGVALGLPPERVHRLRQAAELHDIGKMAIPDSVLDKPGPLDEEEWALIREHTVIGERMLAAAPDMREVATIVRASHERFDGGGYPDGLAGEDIPLEARVVMATDAYCAMTADGSYQAARSSASAIAELRRCAGSQFDPGVVDALVAVVVACASPPRPVDVRRAAA